LFIATVPLPSHGATSSPLFCSLVTDHAVTAKSMLDIVVHDLILHDGGLLSAKEFATFKH
jgi:hypothetical protein